MADVSSRDSKENKDAPPPKETKVVSAANENKVLFKGTEDDARDYVERNFPRHHVDPASPAMDMPEPDVYLVTGSGQKEMYLGPEESDPWQAIKPKESGGKSS